MNIQMPSDDIEIANFRNYVLTVEGTQITSKDSKVKKLSIKVGTNGALHLDLVSSDKELVEDLSHVYAIVPKGYALCHRTEAAKTIRGLTGKYLYFKNSESDFISYVIGPSGKAYKIPLGKITDKNSKLRIVLENLPNDTFYKAYFNDKLPNSIVENRQPIKAALDVLKWLGFVKQTGIKRGISEQYLKTQKAFPKLQSTRLT